MLLHGIKHFNHRPPDPGVDQKVKTPLFQNMFMLHINLKGMTNVVTCISN